MVKKAKKPAVADPIRVRPPRYVETPKPLVVAHNFDLNQMIRLSADGSFPAKHLSPDGLYEITRLMPQDQSGVFHYQVKSAAGLRVVQEAQILADDA